MKITLGVKRVEYTCIYYAKSACSTNNLALSKQFAAGNLRKLRTLNHLLITKFGRKNSPYLIPIILSRVRAILDGFFGLNIRFIGHLYTQLGTASNYNAVANLHTLQITTAHAKPFPTCCVFTSRSLVTASNNGDSSASALKSSLNGGSLPTDSFLHRYPWRTDLVAPVFFLITLHQYPPRPHCSFSNPLPRERVCRVVP
jgi:hypothetical protein